MKEELARQVAEKRAMKFNETKADMQYFEQQKRNIETEEQQEKRR